MLQEYVPNVSFDFRLMLQQVFPCRKLQVFHVDVAYVAVAIHVCCKCIAPNVSDVSAYVARVLSGCCICFTHMFGNVSSGCCIDFHTYVGSVSTGCCICSAMATHVFF